MPTPQITRSAWWDARRLVDTIAGGAPLTRQTSRQLGMLAAAVALLLAFSLGTWLWPRPPVQPVSGGLVIDAAPWATVTKIEGQAPAATLQPMTATPLFVKLSPGEYVVTLVGPPPRQEQRTVRVRIESNRTDALPVQQFDLMTPERYFDKYHPLQPATAQGTPAGQQ
jgi:uncharacterized protein (DUF58 family)